MRRTRSERGRRGAFFSVAGTTLAGGHTETGGRGGGGAPWGEVFNLCTDRVASAYGGGDRFAFEALFSARE